MRKDTLNDGKEFEKEILTVGEIYDRQGLAYIEKNHVPIIVKNGRPVYLEKKGFDFFGAIYKNHHATFFEAKDIRKELQVRRPEESGAGVKAHQLTRLARLEEFRENAFVLWKNEYGVFRISPRFLMVYVGFGHSLSAIRTRDMADIPHIRQIQIKHGILDILQLL